MAVTEEEALEALNRAGAAGNFFLGGHARKRMKERGAGREDICHALREAKTCRQQPDQRWKVPSFDLDGDDITLITVVEDDVVVVTLF